MAETLEEARLAAQKVQYDFRLGLDLDKIVYRDRRPFDCREITIYIIIMVLFWCITVGYYALWHWAYINYLDISFYCVISFTGALWIIWFSLAVHHCRDYYRRKKERADKRKQDQLREEEEKSAKLKEMKERMLSKNRVQTEAEGHGTEAFNIDTDRNLNTNAKVNLNADVNVRASKMETQENKKLLN